MGNLSETVWQRGRSDAIKWLEAAFGFGSLIFVPAVAAFVANRAGLKGEDVVLTEAEDALESKREFINSADPTRGSERTFELSVSSLRNIRRLERDQIGL